MSLDIIEHFFCCDYAVCGGRCCVEGDGGAPLLSSEAEQIRAFLPTLSPYMSSFARDRVQGGVSYVDAQGERALAIVGARECIFAGRDGGYYCVLERLFEQGKIPFNKPISCRLYPIRLTRIHSREGERVGLEYHRWDICKAACEKGEREKIPLFQFLQKPLTEHFGKEWYDELVLTAAEWRKYKLNGAVS